MRPPAIRASFGITPDELIVDSFAGGGGASTGIEAALGRHVDIAINHDATALSVHAANHPLTRHLCESVWNVDPIEACGGRPVGLLWLSPDCKHFSRAKGAPLRDQGIRGLAWLATRWAKAVRPRVICLENVEEWLGWGPLVDGIPCPRRAGQTFRAWASKLRSYGYHLEWRTLVAADYGSPTSRKRLFLVARCDGLPLAWPDASHGGARRPYRTAAECIDWSLPVPSIFGRKRELADATLRRIARGIERYVLGAAEPFIIPLTHAGDSRVHSIREPLRTVTGANRGELALIAPTLVKNMTNNLGQRVDAPLSTTLTGNHHYLVAPTLVQTGYGEREGQTPRALDLHAPLGTVVGGGQKHALVCAFLAKHFGGHESPGASLARPMSTITARDHHALVTASLIGGRAEQVRAFLLKYHGGERGAGRGQQLGLPLRTLDTSNRFALVTVHGETYAIADIGMRLLQPHELAAAQGFPAHYILDRGVHGEPITKTAQIRLIGNSVCPQVAEAIVAANTRENARRVA